MIERLKTYLGRSEFARGVLVLSSGTVLAQLLPLLAAPILTRLYSPEEFATFGLYSALISILGVLATGKYEFAIMLPENNRDAAIISFLSTFITLVTGVILMVIIIIAHDQIVGLFGNDDIGVWLYFLPLSVVLIGFFQILNFWKSRNKSYSLLSKSKVGKSFVSNLISVCVGLFFFGQKLISSFGLIVGLIFGQIFEIGFLFWSDSIFLKKLKAIIRLSRKDIKTLAKRYINFPKYDVPSELMITASVQLPVLLLNRYFEQAVVGRYFYAHKILSLPLSLIGNSIAQVLFVQLADLKRATNEISQLVLKTYDRLMTIGAIPFSIVGVFGPEIFQFVFGDDWRQAGVFAAIISPWLLFNFAGSPMTIIFSILEKQKQMFFWMAIMFISRIVSLFVGFIYFKDAYLSIFLFSASGTLFYFFMNFYLVSHLSKIRAIDFLKSTFIKPSLILVGVLILRQIIMII